MRYANASRPKFFQVNSMPINAIPLFPPDACLKPDDTLQMALELMLKRQINHAPVCDVDGVFIGLISTNAILSALVPASAQIEGGVSSLKFVGDALPMLSAHLLNLERLKVADFVKKDIPALRNDSPILETAKLLADSTAPLAVVDQGGRLLGVLSRRAMLAYLLARQKGG